MATVDVKAFAYVVPAIFQHPLLDPIRSLISNPTVLSSRGEIQKCALLFPRSESWANRWPTNLVKAGHESHGLDALLARDSEAWRVISRCTTLLSIQPCALTRRAEANLRKLTGRLWLSVVGLTVTRSARECNLMMILFIYTLTQATSGARIPLEADRGESNDSTHSHSAPIRRLHATSARRLYRTILVGVL